MHGEERELELPADPRSASVARRAIRELAEHAHLSPMETYDVTLAVSEAVANAVEHGSPNGGPVHLTLRASGGSITVEVRDSGRFPAPPRGDASERGRGLPIIGILSDRVELRPSPDGTTLRFAMGLAHAA